MSNLVERPLKVLCLPDPTGRAAQNPYLRLLGSALGEAGVIYRGGDAKRIWSDRFDIVHIHWPEHFVRDRGRTRSLIKGTIVLTGLLFAKARGKTVVWTVHNAKPHQAMRGVVRRSLWTVISRVTSGVILLSAASRKDIEREHPWIRQKPQTVIAHGHYRDSFPPLPSKEACREALGIAAGTRVLIHFGNLSVYKGVVDLAEAFALAKRPGDLLIIAGPISNDLLGSEEYSKWRSLLEDPLIRLFEGFVSDVDLSRMVRAADVAVFPYRKILNSGSLLMSLSCGTPVIISESSSINEVSSRVPGNWVYSYKGGFSADVLRSALADISADAGDRPINPDLTAYDWGTLARAHVSFFQHLRSSAKR